MADKKEIEIKITSDNKNLYGGKTLSEWISSTISGSTKQERNTFIEAFQKFTKEEKERFSTEIEQYATNVKDYELMLTKKRQSEIKQIFDKYIRESNIDVNRIGDKEKNKIQKQIEDEYVKNLRNVLIESKKRDIKFIQKILSAQTNEALNQMKYVVADTKKTSTTSAVVPAKKRMATQEQIKAARETAGKPLIQPKQTPKFFYAKNEKELREKLAQGYIVYIDASLSSNKDRRKAHKYDAKDKGIQKVLEESGAYQRQHSTTQMTHFLESGYFTFEEELKDLQSKRAKLDPNSDKKLIAEIDKKIVKVSDILEAYQKKSPVGNYIHRLIELYIDKQIDLNDVEKTVEYVNKHLESDELFSGLKGKNAKGVEWAVKQANMIAQAAKKRGIINETSQAESSGALVYMRNGKMYMKPGAIDVANKDYTTGDWKSTGEFKPQEFIGQAILNGLQEAVKRLIVSGALPTSTITRLPITSAGYIYRGTKAPSQYEIRPGDINNAVEFLYAITDMMEGKMTKEDAINAMSASSYRVLPVEYTDKEGETRVSIGGKSISAMMSDIYKKYKDDPQGQEKAANSLLQHLQEEQIRHIVNYISKSYLPTMEMDEFFGKFVEKAGSLYGFDPNGYKQKFQVLGGMEFAGKDGIEFEPYSRDENKKNIYEPNEFEIAEAQDEANLWDDIKNNRKDINSLTAPQMVKIVGRRLARVIDYANKVNTVSRFLSAQHPELGDDINNISTSLLKVSNLKSLDRYFRSQDLLEKFPQMGTDEDKFRFAVSSLRSDSTEESELMSMLETMAKSNEQIDGKSLIELVQQAYLGWADFFNKEQKSVPYPTLQSIITGDLQGYDEEDLRPEYAKRRAAVGDLPVDIGTISQYLLQLANEEYKNQKERKIAYANRFPKNMEEPQYDNGTFSENTEKYQEDIDKLLSSIAEGYKDQEQVVEQQTEKAKKQVKTQEDINEVQDKTKILYETNPDVYTVKMPTHASPGAKIDTTVPNAVIGGNGPIPVYPAGQGGDLDPNKTYRETGITVDAENKIVSRTLKEVQKRQSGNKRGTPQLDVIKQIKEDTGKIVNIMENQPAGGSITIIRQDEPSSDSTSGGSKKGKSKEDKQKEKEEKQAAAQRKRDNQEYAKSLKTVYDYQLKIDDARRKSNITSGRERKSQQEFINTTQKQLKAAQRIAQEKRKVVTDKDAALIESGLEGQFSVKRAAIYTKDKGARNIFDLMGDDIKRAFQRITDFGVSARILNKVQKEIANVYQNILKLNEAMTDIRIVTGANVDEANSLMTSYNKLAKELGTTTTEVAKSASEWMRQGYTASESVNLIASSVKLARLGFMDMTSATTSLTAVLKGFNLQATESSEIVDKLTKLDAEYATTAGDIANALSRTAAAAKAANLDLDQTASMLTTIIDITQQDAGSVGNALKTILSRYGNVKAGVFAGMEEDGEDASESINDVEKVLNTIGIQIRSTSTEMRGFDEVLDDLAEKWDNLNDVEQNAVATAMAGVRQRNQFLALMQNYDQYKESLESSRTSSGTADEKYAAVMDSIATSMQKIQTAWESFTQKLQASGFVKGFFKTIAFVVERIDKFLPHAVALLTSMTARHLPVLGMQIKGLFGDKSSAGRFVRSVFGRGKTFEEESLKQLGQYKKGIGYKDDELSDAERRALGVGGLENTTDDKTALNTDQIKSDVGAIKSWLLNNKKDKVSSQDAPDNAKQDGYSSVNKNKKSTNYLKKIRIISGAITGLATGISSGMTANYGDFTSGADKAITGLASGVATGLISAIPVVGPLFGNILGPLIGQGIGKIFYNEFHKEEIARRARVDEAKKQLEATQKVESAITSAEELTSKDRSEWGSEEYKQEKELIDQMRFGLQTSSSLAENFAKLSGASTEASDWIIQLSRDLTELDESVVANYRAAQILTEAQETYKAGEEDRAALYDKLGSTEASMLNQIQNIDSASSEYLEKRKEYESEYGRTVESGIASMQQAQMQLDAFTDALHEGYMKAAFYSSGVSQMSSADITGASLDRVVAEVARAWAASDATALVFANGTLLESARKQIVAYLKTQSDFTSLTKSPGGSLRDIMGARDEIGTYLQRTNGDYERLKNIVNQQDFKKIREFFGYDAENTENDSYIKDLIDQINKADPSNIELIAHGMNMTTEQAENLKSVIGSISLEDILNGASKLLDKFETLNGILGDISEDSILSPENINKVVSAFPDLFKEFDENGNFTGNISSGNIIGNLVKLVTDPNGALATAYAGLAAKESLTDKNKWKIFQDSAKANQKALGITDEQLSDIMTAKDFNSQAQLMLSNQNLMVEWAKIVTETTGVADYAEQARNVLIEAENKSLEKQIDNLQSIKDSIGDINKQREKELDLIKARDALENAKKEKKLVYRAGIGFVATSDSSAIQEAQKKVDDLQNQQTQEDLQYQIDQLNQQKAILEAFQNDPKIESIKKSAKAMEDALSKGGEGTILGYLQTLSTDTFVNNIKNAIKESAKENTQDVLNEEYISSLKNYNKSVTDYQGWLDTEARKDENGNSVYWKDILNNTADRDYSAAKEQAESFRKAIEQNRNDAASKRKSSVLSSEQISKEMNGNYYSPEAGIDGLMNEKGQWNQKLEDASNTFLISADGVEGQRKMAFYARLLNEEITDPDFISNQINKDFENSAYIAKRSGSGFERFQKAKDLNKNYTEWSKIPDGYMIINVDHLDDIAYKDGGKLFQVSTKYYNDGDWKTFGDFALDFHNSPDSESYQKIEKMKEYADSHGISYNYLHNAKGTYNTLPGNHQIINELGTEAIVTPQGTLTSLPSHSGIVPADLTKNLFALGEIAPNLIATLRNQMPNVSKSNSTSNDNSTNIGTVYATFNADSGFDMNRFMIDLRSAAGNTRHNN